MRLAFAIAKNISNIKVNDVDYYSNHSGLNISVTVIADNYSEAIDYLAEIQNRLISLVALELIYIGLEFLKL